MPAWIDGDVLNPRGLDPGYCPSRMGCQSLYQTGVVPARVRVFGTSRPTSSVSHRRDRGEVHIPREKQKEDLEEREIEKTMIRNRKQQGQNPERKEYDESNRVRKKTTLDSQPQEGGRRRGNKIKKGKGAEELNIPVTPADHYSPGEFSQGEPKTHARSRRGPRAWARVARVPGIWGRHLIYRSIIPPPTIIRDYLLPMTLARRSGWDLCLNSFGPVQVRL